MPLMKGNLNNRQATPFTRWGPKRTAVLVKHTYSTNSGRFQISTFLCHICPPMFTLAVFFRATPFIIHPVPVVIRTNFCLFRLW